MKTQPGSAVLGSANGPDVGFGQHLMAHLVKHFRLVHDTAPFVLLPFYNPEVEECPVQRPNRDFTARGLAIGPHSHYPSGSLR